MAHLTEMFGDNLLAKEGGKVSTVEALSGKTLMVYFSAHWCPPCRGFTPMLSKFYTDMKAKRSDMELVFVSSDKEEGAFQEYYGEMPWLALPFENREANTALSKKFKVSGIPTLVVLSAEGTTITTDAVQEVSGDPDGEKFPWVPPTFAESFPSSELLGKSGETVALPESAEYLMLYFSAHWCPPCRAFTPKLVEVYKALKEQRSDFELVFVSSDRDQGSFDEYYGEMPWLAVPFSNRQAKMQLGKLFGVSGIPSLVVLGPKKEDGSRPVITDKGTGCADMDQLSEFPWYPKPYGELSAGGDCNGSDVNESAAIVVLCEGADDDDQDRIKEVVKKVATERGSSELLFFYATKMEGPVPQVRKLCGLPNDGEVVMLKLDIPDNGGYYVSSCKDVTVESMMDFIANSGERKQLRK